MNLKMNNTEISKIYNKVNFVEKEVLKFDEARGSLIASGLIGDSKQEGLLKVSKINPIKTRNFHKEALVGEAIKKHNGQFAPKIDSMLVLATGHDETYIWLLREFFQGRSLGDSTSTAKSPLYNHDNIRDEYLPSCNEIIPNIYKAISDFSFLKDVLAGHKINHPELFQERFLENIESYDLEQVQAMTGIDLKPLVEFYNKEKKNYFDESNIVASMGDLVPSNIIIKDGFAVSLTDFEWVSMDNYTMDIAFLWLFFWKYREWQDAWILKTIKSDADKVFFRMSIIRAILGLGWIPNFLGTQHKWLSYLQNAGESFEALINTK